MLCLQNTDFCKNANSQHPPYATEAVGDEGAAGVVEAWLAVQDHCGQEDDEARNTTDDNRLVIEKVLS